MQPCVRSFPSIAPKPSKRPLRAVHAALLLLLFADCRAQPLAQSGCPISHCTPEATGVTARPFIQKVLVSNTNSALGTLHAEGCTGNGARLMCLYIHDTAGANRKGTLKVLNATTLKAIWGSAAAADSYDLDPHTAANGQVPVNFANGSIAAGDAWYHVLYDSSGAVLGQLPVGGEGNNFGLTPLSATYGVVSQGDGVLTLVNLTTWDNAGTLQLLDPSTGDPVNLIGPSSGTMNALYAIGYNAENGDGLLFSVVIDQTTKQLKVRSTFRFTGQSGASPVIVTPAVSGLPNTLILLHVPGLIGDSNLQNRLLGLSDSAATGLVQSWAIPLAQPLAVSPTVDQATQSLFYEAGVNIHQNSLMSGDPIRTFDLQAIGAFPKSFRLVGHIGATEVGSVFTLLLTGTYSTSRSSGEQSALAFQPIESPNALAWSEKISDVTGGYSGGWNFAPSTQSGIVCPVAISINGARSTIVRLCDH